MGRDLVQVNVPPGYMFIVEARGHFPPVAIQFNGGAFTTFADGIDGGWYGATIHFNDIGTAYVVPNPPPPAGTAQDVTNQVHDYNSSVVLSLKIEVPTNDELEKLAKRIADQFSKTVYNNSQNSEAKTDILQVKIHTCKSFDITSNNFNQPPPPPPSAGAAVLIGDLPYYPAYFSEEALVY